MNFNVLPMILRILNRREIMVTQTSKLAYRELNEEGVGDTQKEKILDVVSSYFYNYDKGLSNREISNLTGFEINAVSGRVNDLKKEGLIVEAEKKKDKQTNKLVQTVIPKISNKENKDQFNLFGG